MDLLFLQILLLFCFFLLLFSSLFLLERSNWLPFSQFKDPNFFINTLIGLSFSRTCLASVVQSLYVSSYHWRKSVDFALRSHKNDGSDLDFLCDDICTGSLTLLHLSPHSVFTDRRPPNTHEPLHCCSYREAQAIGISPPPRL